MTLRRLRTAVCLLAVLSIGTTVLPAWAADPNNCAAGGGGSGSGGGGSGASAESGGSAGSTGCAAAATSVGVAPAHNGGIGLNIRSGIGGAGNGGLGGNGGGIDAGGDPSGATSLLGAQPYSLRAIYFRRDQFRSPADCLTAAHTRRLPLEVCQ